LVTTRLVIRIGPQSPFAPSHLSYMPSFVRKPCCRRSPRLDGDPGSRHTLAVASLLVQFALAATHGNARLAASHDCLRAAALCSRNRCGRQDEGRELGLQPACRAVLDECGCSARAGMRPIASTWRPFLGWPEKPACFMYIEVSISVYLYDR